jgi:hypothetical protein
MQQVTTSTVVHSNIIQASPADLCKPEGLVYKLLTVQFYGDLGRKFITPVLAPVVREVISYGKELEVRFSHNIGGN